MKSWLVRLKITGWAAFEVDADSEHEAIQEAKERMTIDDLEDWEPAYSDREHSAECLDDDEDDEEEEEDDDDEE